MVNELNMPKAYTETLEILKHISKSDYNKLPEDLIMMFESEKDKEYKYTVEHIKDFENQEMLIETKYILAVLFRDYWANEKQRQIILSKEKRDNEIEEENKRKLYNSNDIFKKKEISSKPINEVKEVNTQMIEYKQNFYQKILNWFKRLFSK